jgi:hypothetical protein
VSQQPILSDAFLLLLDAACDGTLDESQFLDLEKTLDSDEELRALFLNHICLRRKIHTLHRRKRACDAGLSRVQALLSDEALRSGNTTPPTVAAASQLGMFGGGSNWCSVSDWIEAYMIATVVLAVGIVIGAFTYVSQPERSFVQSEKDAERRSETGEKPQSAIVGRITGMVSCKLAQSSNLQEGSLVHVNDRFALTAGLMEITYKTGAKVVLDGPVTYEAESAFGGYLAIGKLTGRVECETAKGFAIRTPTAIVTDIGTEFGVDVSQTGDTKSYVFRGVIEVQAFEKGIGVKGRAVRLAEHDSVVVTKNADGAALTVRHDLNGTAFVRAEQMGEIAKRSKISSLQRWQAYSRRFQKDPALTAYYTFESAGKDNSVLPNSSPIGSVLDGRVEGAEWVYGRWPQKFALLFHGAETNNKVVLPEQQRFNFTGPFSIAVWFQTVPFPRDAIPSLIAKGASSWRIQRYGNNTQKMTIDTSFVSPDGRDYPMPPGRTEVGDGRWHLIVAVVDLRKDSHRKQVYIDGRLDSEVTVPVPMYQGNDEVWIGMSNTFADRDWNGRIDEVAILARAMSSREISEMYEAGNPASSQQR